MIILLGYMGSGKSAVGKALAADLALEHVDLDDHISVSEGMSVAALFRKKGEVYFRKKETEVLQKLLTDNPAIVLSLGGGTPCFGNNADLISQSEAKAFYLNASVSTLSKRLAGQRKHRPLIAHLRCNVELIEFIGKHLFERTPYYRKAGQVINVDGKNVTEIVSEIKNRS